VSDNTEEDMPATWDLKMAIEEDQQGQPVTKEASMCD
jgi:hypothetical protein